MSTTKIPSTLDLANIPILTPKPKTILEIGGYPHYENVISNYLQYYANPSENHGFNDIIIRTLIEKGQGDLSHYSLSENISIQREVITKKGRIDLLIISDGYAIAIENKIFHHSNSNPFDDYENYLKDNYPDFKHICFILSLKKEKKKPHHGVFKNITYNELFAPIKRWVTINYINIINPSGLFFFRYNENN